MGGKEKKGRMIDFTKLDPEFIPLLKQLIENMEALGHKVNPYYGLRTLKEQAKIWRRSRTTAQVDTLRYQLVKGRADYARTVLESVGPQKMGPWGTDTYMYSYHLLGKACDMFIDEDERGGPVYDILAAEALKLGLTPGRNFSHKDSGHIQLGKDELTKTYSLYEMDKLLYKKSKIKEG
jgi:hypothetical protein